MRLRGCLLVISLLLIAPSLFGETYSASGVVLFADRDHLALKVSCQEIPGYREAMVMTFPVHDSKVLDGLKPGMMIDFKLDVRKDTAYAEQIRVRAYENAMQEPMAARQLEILDAATSSRLLTHSLHTVIVDRQGRFAANLEDNEYTAKQLGDLAEAVMARQ